MRPGARRRADRECPAKILALRRSELVEELLLGDQQTLRPPVDPKPGLGRLDAAARAIEKPVPQPFLERPNLLAHRRLGDAQALGGLREAPTIDHGAKRDKLTRIHKGSL